MPYFRPVSVFALLVALPLTACVLADDSARVATALPPEAAEVDLLAAQGNFPAVRQKLAAVGNPAFLTELKEWDAIQIRRTQARHTAFAAKCTELDQSIAADEQVNALINLIEAKMLADDAGAFLAEKRSADLIQRIEGLATKAEAAHDWVEAGTLYRLLNSLFDQTRPYLTQAKRVSQHEQALALYNPKKLIALYKEQAKRAKLAEKQGGKNGRKKKTPIPDGDSEDPEIETTPWQDRLANITPRMLQEALFLAAKRHIERPSYATLITGAMDGLDTTLTTDGLAETVPALADAKKVADFRAGLAALRADCVAHAKTLNLSSAIAALSHISELNERTLGLPENMVTYELGMGLTSRLDDFSNLIWPEQMKEFERMISGEFYGIGVQLSRETSELTVITPMADTPAMRAGIRAGDVITHVNGKPTATWSIDKAIREITGEEGTPVSLRLRRAGVEQPINLELKRAKIEMDSIRGWTKKGDAAEGKWDYWLDKDQGVAYIRMTQFIGQTAKSMDDAIAQTRKEAPIRALVLDLRYNPGGLLYAAADIADRFLDHGRIVSTVNAAGEANQVFSAHAGNEYGDFPVVVLVNEGSASASEILSGALQENHRVFVMGTNSFGKGSVQNIMPIAHQDALFKLTIEHYALPSGHILHREPGSKDWGVHPDLKVAMTPDELRAMVDAREEADYGQDITPDNGHGPYTTAEILKEGLDPQVLAAKLYLETVLEARKLMPVKTAVK